MICAVPGCHHQATYKVSRWPVCSGHRAAVQASLRVGAKSIAVAMAPRLLKRFPKLATVAKVVQDIKAEREGYTIEGGVVDGAPVDDDVVEAEVINVEVIHR